MVVADILGSGYLFALEEQGRLFLHILKKGVVWYILVHWLLRWPNVLGFLDCVKVETLMMIACPVRRNDPVIHYTIHPSVEPLFDNVMHDAIRSTIHLDWACMVDPFQYPTVSSPVPACTANKVCSRWTRTHLLHVANSYSIQEPRVALYDHSSV